MSGSAFELPASLIPPEAWPAFCAWARDGGYDQSHFNRHDSKSRALEAQYLEEQTDEPSADPVQ